MPLTTIETNFALADDKVEAVASAVFNAQMTVLKVSQEDKCVRVMQHQRSHFIGSGSTERILLVQIALYSGRDRSTRARLIQRTIDELESNGFSQNEILVVLIESERQNWYFGSGKSTYTPRR